MDTVLFDLYRTLINVNTDETDTVVWQELARLVSSWSPASVESDYLYESFQYNIERHKELYGDGMILQLSIERVLEALGVAPLEWRVAKFAQVFRRQSRTKSELYSFTLPLLRELSEHNISTAIVSNTESLMTEWDLLDLGLMHAVDTILLSSRAGIQKPDPRIFIEAMHRLNAEPSNTVMVGDSKEDDIKGAKATSMASIHIKNEKEDTEDEQSVGEYHLAATRSLQDLRSTLKQLGAQLDS